MPNRIYTCKVLDGMGDIGHMIDRAGANMALDPQFRQDNPETYVLDFTNHEHKIERFLEKARILDPLHPLHISNLGSSVYITGYKDIPEEKYEKLQGAIIYRVSAVYFPEPSFDSSSTIHIDNLEFQSILFEDDPLHRNMGFGPGKYGIFVKDEPTAESVDVKTLMHDLTKCTDEELLIQIFGSSNYEEGIKAFQSGERVLIPVYSNYGGLAEVHINIIKKISVMAGKHLVFFGTGNVKFERESDSETTFINKNYVDQYTYNTITQLKSSNILFFGGDKSFEAVLNAGAMPLRFLSWYKGQEPLLKVIKGMKVDEVYSEQHQKLIRVLDKDDVGLLTPELMEYWQKVCIPYIKENWNYYNIIPKMEEQAVALYKIKENPDREDVKDLWNKFSLKEKLALLGNPGLASYDWVSEEPKILRSLQNSINLDVTDHVKEEQENKHSKLFFEDTQKIKEDIVKVTKAEGAEKISKLVLAAANGDLETIKDLAKELGQDINKSNAEGWSALTAATYYGEEKIVKELVEHFGADINQEDGNGNTAVTVAVSPCEEDVLKIAGEHSKVGKHSEE